jgi:hypothetical protein
MHRSSHRLLSGSAAVLIAAAIVAAPGTPALAAAPTLRLHFPDLSVAAGSVKTDLLFASIDVPAGQGAPPVTVGKLTVTVDTAGVAPIAAVDAPDDLQIADDQVCARAGSVLTCTLSGPLLLGTGTNLLPLVGLQVAGKPGAAAGAHGELKFTAQADAGPVATGHSTVTIGEGVDLAGFDAKPTPVAAGATVAADLRVANVGAKPVTGVVLAMLGWDPSLLPGKGFSNCRYGILTVGTFDDDLATGTTYELSTPMKLAIPSDAAAGSRASAIGGWYTPSDFQELLEVIPDGDDAEVLGPKGTGGPVALRAVPASKKARAAQVDTNLANNVLSSEVVVTGGTKPDEAAVGATVTGAAGDKVRAKLGFVNNGPGTLYHWSFDNTDPATQVTVPAGLRTVQADERCIPMPTEASPEPGDDDDDVTWPSDPSEDYDVTDASGYLCFTEGGKTKAHAATLFDFTFQLRSGASAAPGQVRINADLFGDGETLDRDAGNDTAKIEVDLTGGGGGGGLPVTGANAGLLGAGGAVLTLVGALGLLLLRRRRTRFTA